MRSKHIKILFIVVLLGILLFFHFKGVVYYDEGYILNSGLRIAHGEIPYRDFDFVYTPLSPYITAFFLKLIGESVFVGRLSALVISLISLLALYKLLRLITKNVIFTFFSLLFFIAWGPAHVNFPWPTMLAVCFFFYTTLFFVQGLVKKNSRYFLLSGIMVAFVFLSKQNFGVIIFFISLLSFYILQNYIEKKSVYYYIGGAGFIILLFNIFLIGTSSFLAFYQNLYLYTYKRIIVQKVLDTPFLYEGTVFQKVTKFFFYTSPLSISIASLLISFRSQKKLMVLPLFTIFFYAVGIRPTTDYDHFVPLLSTCVLPFSVIFSNTKKIVIKNLVLLVYFFMVVFGFYTAYFYGYYKWEVPLRDQTYFAKNSRLGVYMSKQKLEELEGLISYVKLHTKEKDPILVNYYAPLLYFVLDRPNPSPYDLISGNDIPDSYQKDVVNRLKRRNVSLIIMNELNKNDKGVIAEYTRKTYPKIAVFGDYIVFTK